MTKREILATQILDLLASQTVLIFTRGKTRRRAIHEHCDKVWFEMNRKVLFATLDKLKLRGYVEVVKGKDSYKMAMTRDGASYRLKRMYNALTLNQEKKWDKKWRMVLFDIPEPLKPARDALRTKLKKLGFKEFQKSVFVFPYPCEEEVNFVLNYHEISEYVYLLESRIQPDNKLKEKFGLK
ncbi:MAG: hypothetical protein WC764_02965 [Candidatus Paceibacterota bacterium]|jgi:DNA-binding transcriptional regulator PaaX